MQENEINVISKMDNSDGTFESENRVYGVDAIAPTIPTCAGGGIQPKIIETICLNPKGGRNGIDGLQPSLQDRVFEPRGLSFAVTTSFMTSVYECRRWGGKAS